MILVPRVEPLGAFHTLAEEPAVVVGRVERCRAAALRSIAIRTTALIDLTHVHTMPRGASDNEFHPAEHSADPPLPPPPLPINRAPHVPRNRHILSQSEPSLL